MSEFSVGIQSCMSITVMCHRDIQSISGEEEDCCLLLVVTVSRPNPSPSNCVFIFIGIKKDEGQGKERVTLKL